MTFIQRAIVDEITNSEKISLFFHEIPDFDTLGACFALKCFIKNKFPEKIVNIIGLDILDPSFSKGQFPFDQTHIHNSEIVGSLGIVLDTSNEPRIWSQRHRFCAKLICIDHHPQSASFANIDWIDVNSPATCELVSDLLFEWDPSCMDVRIASYLYSGIITDTGRFLYTSTRPKTLEIAAKLIDLGFDRQKLNDIVYLKSIKQASFEYFVFNLFKYNPELRFGYSIIPKNSYEKFGIDLRLSMVSVFNNIQNLDVWMTFYYDDTVRKWRGSLRSRTIPINTIAAEFNGGGHKLAAGFTLTSHKQIKKFIKRMEQYLKDIQKGE